MSMIDFVLQLMGNTQRKPEDYSIVKTYSRQNWQKDSTKKEVQIWINKNTQERVQVYSIADVPSISDMSIYQTRASEPHLVRVVNIAMDNHKYSCVSHLHSQLLLQYIPVRLSQVRQIDLEEALTIMYACFKGFYFIQKALGHFQINEELIGFTEEGKPKVWINKQFDKNKSQEQKLFVKRNQGEQIKQIYHMLADRIKGRNLSEELKFELLINSHNFQSAVSVLQEFSVKEELSLRRYIRIDLVQRMAQNKYMLRHARNYSAINILDTERFSKRGNSFYNLQKIGRAQNMSILNSRLASPRNHDGTSVIFQQKKQNYQVKEGSNIISCRSAPKITFSTSTGAFSSPQPKNFKLPQSRSNNSPPSRIFNSPQHRTFNSPQHRNLNNLQTFNRTKQIIQFVSPVRQIPKTKSENTNKITFKIPTQTHSMIDKNSHQKHSSLIHELKQNNFQSLPSQKRPSRQDKILQQDTVKEKEIVAIPQNIKQNQSQINKSDDPQPQPMPSLYIQSQLNQEIALSGGFKQLQSGVMDTNVEQPTLSSKREDKQIINKQTNSNIAVSFQSFGLHQIKHINPPSLQVQQAQPQTQMVLHTSQSLQMQQNSKEESSFQSNSFQRRSPQQSSCIKMVQSGEECFLKQTQKIKKQHVDFKRYSQKSNSNSSSSNEDILNMDVDKKQQKNPFYANYTSVQSKFDIMVKKDSNAEQLIREQHQRKISGLANLQDQEQDEQNKQIYKDIIVNKVDSQYQQFMDKNSAFSQSMKIGGKCHSNVLFSPRSIEEEDFLDVQFMEKSLDFKYNSGFKKKKQEKEEADDQLNVANLDSKLSKYEASQKSIKKEQLPQSQLNIHQSIDNTNKVIHSQSAMSQRVGIKKLPSIQYKTAKDGFRPEESSDKNINGFSSSYYQQMNFYDFTMETHKSPQTNQSSLGKTGNTSNYYKSIRHYSSLQKDPYYSTNNRQNNQIQKSNKVKRPPYDQSRNRLQDRYKKYVKQVRSPSKVFTSPTPKEPKKADRQSKERLITSQYQIEQQMPTFRKKQKSPEAKANKNRISYDQLRSILLN